MRKRIMIWIINPLIVTAVYCFLNGTHWKFYYQIGDPNIAFAEISLPIIFTLVIPLLMGLIISGISYLFTKKFSSVFIEVVGIVQWVGIAFVLLGYCTQKLNANCLN